MAKNKIKIIFGNISKEQENEFYVREEDFETPHGEDYKLAIDFLKNLNSKEIEGKSIMEYLYFDGVSYWWFIYQSLIPELKKQLNFISNFSIFLKNKKPSKVILEQNFEYFELIKQICKNLKIDFSFSKLGLIKFRSKVTSKNSIQKMRYEKIHQKKIETRKNLFSKNSKLIPNISNKVLFPVSSNFRRMIYDYENEIFKRGEFGISNLFTQFNRNDIIGIDLDYTFQGDSSVLLERLSDDFTWIPIEILLANNKVNPDLIKNFNKLILNSDFQNLFIFMGINFWHESKIFFEKMCLSPFLPFYSHLTNSLTEYFSNFKPKAIFIPYETGSLALSIISACKNLDIPTFGIQHGYIYPYNPMYSYGKIISESEPFGFPIPDFLLLYGNYTKQLLISNGYPADKLIAFGNIFLFNLEQFKLKFNYKKSLEKFSINKNEKIILVTTGKLQRGYSSAGKYDYDEKIIENLLRKFSNNNNYKIIIKPHPTEFNIQVYDELIKKYSSNNVIISNENIFELISLSSVLISVFSTTMYDALCFEKPVIRVNFSKSIPHQIDLSEVVIVSSLTNLNDTVIDLSKNLSSENFSIKSKDFIKEQFGLPEKNIKNEINNLLG